MAARKLAFFLPNTFTALNLGCGFASIVLSFQGVFFEAAVVLILGAIFDSVDGRVARLTGTQSSFGEQFDSMSDVVSFGVAPSILIYNAFLSPLGRLGAMVSFVYLLCGALRLARFNANIEKVSSDYFQGLPIPGAAVAVVGLVLISPEVSFINQNAIIPLVYSLVFSILMITNIPFPSFKNSQWVREHKKRALAIIFIVSALTFVYYKYMFAIGLVTYTITSILYFLTHKGDFSEIFEWKNE